MTITSTESQTEGFVLSDADRKNLLDAKDGLLDRDLIAQVERIVTRLRAADAARIEALSTHLAKKVRPPALPIGTRVAVRSFKGQVGTVIAGDGTENHPGLGVIMDRPWPKGFPDGHACVSLDEVTVVP